LGLEAFVLALQAGDDALHFLGGSSRGLALPPFAFHPIAEVPVGDAELRGDLAQGLWFGAPLKYRVPA
jgi:hypothetical protein